MISISYISWITDNLITYPLFALFVNLCVIYDHVVRVVIPPQAKHAFSSDNNLSPHN